MNVVQSVAQGRGKFQEHHSELLVVDGGVVDVGGCVVFKLKGTSGTTIVHFPKPALTGSMQWARRSSEAVEVPLEDATGNEWFRE